jgi:hypothetical protein
VRSVVARANGTGSSSIGRPSCIPWATGDVQLGRDCLLVNLAGGVAEHLAFGRPAARRSNRLVPRVA